MQISRPTQNKVAPPPLSIADEIAPEELEKKKKRSELNESTYYSTRGTHGSPGQDVNKDLNTSYFA